MIAPGFMDQPRDAAFAFRTALTALSRPGTIAALPDMLADLTPPAPLSPAAAVLILTLCDRTTGIWLAPAVDTAELRHWITFHTGASFVAPDAAQFAVGDWSGLIPVTQFAQGTADYPDRSATLIIDIPTLTNSGTRLSGPGIRDHAHLSIPDPAPLKPNAALFPRGVDIFFCCGAQVAGLPRTTRLEDN